MIKPLIKLKIVNKNGQKVRMAVTRKIRRIHSFLKADKSRVCLYKLSVRYDGDFKNEGNYATKEDLIFALKTFLEK